MVMCQACNSYEVKSHDRYCGLCGAPLPVLEVDNGGQIAFTPGGSGKVTLLVGVANVGSATMRLWVTPPDGVQVDVDDKGMRLDPQAPRRWIELAMDATRLGGNGERVLTVPLQWDVPNAPRPAPLRVVIEDEGGLDVPNECEVGHVAVLREAPEWSEPVPFRLAVRNLGGLALKVTLGGMADSYLDVAFEEGEAAWVRGYESATLRLAARCRREPGPNEVNIPLTLMYDSADETLHDAARVMLRTAPQVVAAPEVAPLDFGRVAARENRTARLRVTNHGSRPFSIVGVDTQCACLRALTDLSQAIAVPAGGSNVLEFYFSTQLGGVEVCEDLEIQGNVVLEVEGLPRARLLAPWRAEVCALPGPDEVGGILAIDFGTVYSCLAYDAAGWGEPDVVNVGDNGNPLVSSVLSFLGPDMYVIGERALEASQFDPDNTVHSVKRCLDEGERTFYGRAYSPKDLAALLIEQLLIRAMRVQGERPERLAMTVPSSFWGPKREAIVAACNQAVRGCCRMPGEEAFVPVDVHDEPTAAAFLHISEHAERFGVADQQHRVMVFDFGGGTLDISVVEIGPVGRGRRVVRPLIARGENYLGGIDLDLATLWGVSALARAEEARYFSAPIEEMRTAFERRTLSGQARRTFQGARYQWITTARTTKEQLSSRNRQAFQVAALYDENAQRVGAYNHEVTRDEFRGFIAPYLQTAYELVQSTLQAAELGAADIDAVLMAGQSCRIPAVQGLLRGLFGAEKVYGATPEEQGQLKSAVAQGAALASYLLSQAQEAEGSWDLQRLERSSYRYGRLERGNDLQYHFYESIAINQAFSEPGRAAKLPVRGQEGTVRIVQYAGNVDVFPDYRNQPGLTRLGTVRVRRGQTDAAGMFTFALGFSRQDSQLVALVNGQETAIDATDTEELERVYL